MDVNVNWVMGESVLTLRFPVGLSVKVPDPVPDLGMPVRTTVA